MTDSAKIFLEGNKDAERAGYEILWRETTEARWSVQSTVGSGRSRGTRARARRSRLPLFLIRRILLFGPLSRFRPTTTTSPRAASGRTAGARSRSRPSRPRGGRPRPRLAGPTRRVRRPPARRLPPRPGPTARSGRNRHDPHDPRLGDRRGVLRPLDRHRPRLHEEGRRVARAVLRRGARRALVAGGRRDDRDDLRRRHAARRHGPRRRARRRGQLDLVELRHERHAHGVPLRAPLAPREGHDGRGVRRDPLQRPARHLPARLPRALPRAPHQPHHPRLGHPRDGEDPPDLARHPADLGGGRLLRHHGRLFRRRGHVGRPLDRPRPARHQDDGRHPARVVRREEGGRHRRAEDGAREALRLDRHRHLVPAARGLRVDADDRDLHVPRGAVVGGVVSGRRAGRRRLRRAAHLLGADRSATASSRRCSSTSGTTRSARGRGSSRASRPSSSIPAASW